MGVRLFRYGLHLTIWCLLYFFPYLLSFRGRPDIHTIFSDSGDVIHLVSFILLAVYSYSNYFFFVPRYFLEKKYMYYIGLVALCFFIVIKAPQFVEPPPAFLPHRLGPPGEPPPILFGMSYNIILFLISTFIAISIQLRLLLIRIEQQKLRAEISFLKAQISPHFLFNALNSIYSLAVTNSKETANSIVELSDLMRYVIQDSDADLVDLDQEIRYITNYINLQKRRLEGSASIQYSAPNYTGPLKIAPLLLISFIENAFKYGVNPEHNSVILIRISVSQDTLHLHVQNNKVNAFREKELGGIGIKNTISRLKHVYPVKHHLKIDDGDEIFSVELSIDLSC